MGNEYDLVVIGGGPGGYVAAIRGSQLGLKTALVEKRDTLGGTCANIGCIPSKALLDSSELFARMKNSGAEHGIEAKDLVVNLKAMMDRKDRVVERLTRGILQLMKSNKIKVFTGTGSLKSSREVTVTDKNENQETLVGENIILATGSVPQELPFLPFDGKTIVSSTEALSFDKVPERLVVIGAGAIGLEMGSVWARLGAEVVVIEILPAILPGWDRQLSHALKRDLEKQTIRFFLETKVTGYKRQKSRILLIALDQKGKEVQIDGDKILVAVGRRPFTKGLNLSEIKVEYLEDQKHILVDENYQTSVPGVYAIGDLIHGPMLAHKAEDEGIAAAEIIAGKRGHVSYHLIPGVVYTWPEAACIGQTEEELKGEGIAFCKGYFPFSSNGRSLAMNETSGFVKILSHKKTDEILGVHILGPWASDLISEAAAVMEFRGSAEDLARTMHPHPTLSEAVREAALGADGRMIHGINL